MNERAANNVQRTRNKWGTGWGAKTGDVESFDSKPCSLKRVGCEEYRSPYPSHAKRMLYHVSYTPVIIAKSERVGNGERALYISPHLWKANENCTISAQRPL